MNMLTVNREPSSVNVTAVPASRVFPSTTNVPESSSDTLSGWDLALLVTLSIVSLGGLVEPAPRALLEADIVTDSDTADSAVFGIVLVVIVAVSWPRAVDDPPEALTIPPR